MGGREPNGWPTSYSLCEPRQVFLVEGLQICWTGCGSRCRKGWPDFVVKALKCSVDFLIDIFNHGAACGIGRAGDVALDVVEQGLVVLAVGFERGAEMPHRRTPERRAFGRDTDGAAQVGNRCVRFVQIEEREAGEVFDSSAQ